MIALVVSLGAFERNLFESPQGDSRGVIVRPKQNGTHAACLFFAGTGLLRAASQGGERVTAL